MGKTIIRNMTEGSVFRQLAAFSLPLLLANSLQTLYTTVDTLVVGRFVGTAALSAVLMILTSVMIRLYRKITGTSQLEGML